MLRNIIRKALSKFGFVDGVSQFSFEIGVPYFIFKLLSEDLACEIVSHRTHIVVRPSTDRTIMWIETGLNEPETYRYTLITLSYGVTTVLPAEGYKPGPKHWGVNVESSAWVIMAYRLAFRHPWLASFDLVGEGPDFFSHYYEGKIAGIGIKALIDEI